MKKFRNSQWAEYKACYTDKRIMHHTPQEHKRRTKSPNSPLPQMSEMVHP